jgi:hypothetical protein
MGRVIATKTKIADKILSVLQMLAYVFFLLAAGGLYLEYSDYGYRSELLSILLVGAIPVVLTTILRIFTTKKLTLSPFK